MTAALDELTVLDAAVAPDEVAAWAATAPAWDGIATPVGELDPAVLSPSGRVDLLVALERHRAWIDAQQQRLLAVMAADPGPNPALDREWVREEVACALRISANSAADRLHTATELVDRLPDTLTAVHAGQLSLTHARTLVDAIVNLDDATATKVEAAVLPRGVGQTPAQFTRSVRRAVLAADPRDAEEKHTDAVADRRVVLTPQPDGMAELWALLPADQASALWTALNAAAGRTGPEDKRTVDQRRADTLVERVCHGAAGSGLRPLVQVTVALSTLLVIDDQPGELAGYGPIPAGLLRRIAEDQTGTWRRLVTDPVGQLVDYGRSVYRPPVALADYVTARDQTCRFPTCNRPAETCDKDHIWAWTDGGPTNAHNLEALCGRDHPTKHNAGWHVTRKRDGTTEWTSPTGHVYRKPPDQLPIDHTTEADPDPPPF